MKRLFLFIGILLFTGSVYSQGFNGLLGGFFETPAYLEYQALRKKTPEYLDKQTYSFRVDKTLYMVSYEKKYSYEFDVDGPELPPRPITRSLYLFSTKDSIWTIASNKPLQVDEYTDTTLTSYFTARMDDEKEFRTAHNGSVVLNDDGSVEIVLINFKATHLNAQKTNLPISMVFSNKKIILVPNNDGTYNVKE